MGNEALPTRTSNTSRQSWTHVRAARASRSGRRSALTLRIHLGRPVAVTDVTRGCGKLLNRSSHWRADSGITVDEVHCSSGTESTTILLFRPDANTIRMALSAQNRSTPYESGPSPHALLRTPGNLDREESQLWRWAIAFMILLAVALSALLWERLESIPYQLRAVPIGVLVPFGFIRGLCLRTAARSQRTERAAAGLAGARGCGAFRRATGPTQPGHHALAAQLQGTD